MAHVYQPVMIRYLLSNGGVADDVSIALEISQQDPSQIEYYREITNRMVGKVLRERDIVEKVGKTFVLKDFSNLSTFEIQELIHICTVKLDEYIAKRGSSIWAHRVKSRASIPGSIRYKVFLRAKFRCELCGVMDSEKALEIDHILPITLGGKNIEDNYQALCYSCNANKRHTDSTDFRGIEDKYHHREDDCIFCIKQKSKVIVENELAYMVYDQYPVTDLHALIIPKRHFAEYFEIFQPELNAMQRLIMESKSLIQKTDKSVDSFNIGVNSGSNAGQTIFQCHLHLIPRRANDTANPRGGVRGVIPGKMHY